MEGRGTLDRRGLLLQPGFEVTLEGQAKGIPGPEQPVGGPEVGESSMSLKKGVEAIAS